MSMPFSVPGRLVLDRLCPASRGWRRASEIDVASLATALGLRADKVASLEVVEVDHGTAQRSRVLVRQVDGATTSLFVKNTPLALAPGLLNGAARLCEREAAFYADLATSVPSAPRALISVWDAVTGRSTVVLPDLVDEGFWFEEACEPCAPDQVGLALDAMADLHGAFSQAQGGLAADPIYSHDGPGSARISKLACWAVGRRPRTLVELVPPAVLEQSKILADRAGDFAGVLSGFPQAFLHNDTHRGNLGFAADRAILIDWQNCGWGPAMKDVAYLMVTALEPDVRREHERALIDRYLAGVAASGGPSASRDDAWEAYRVLAITGYLAAAFTALFRNRLQAAANSEASLRRAAAAVADLDSFAAFRQRLESRVPSRRCDQ